MMGLDNPVHILIVLCVALLLFGAKRLPEMGRGLGQGMREFKESVTGKNGDLESPPAEQMTAAPLAESEHAVTG